jgi:hypothetical protein
LENDSSKTEDENLISKFFGCQKYSYIVHILMAIFDPFMPTIFLKDVYDKIIGASVIKIYK